MKKQLIKLGYNITTDSQFQNNRFGITPELAKQLEKLDYEALDKNNKKIINKLTQLITDHPTVPLLKNYLSVAYHTQGNYDKAVEINNSILSEHPDYLFARLNKANVYIDNGEFEKVSEVMGGAMEIKLLYPERDLFHLAEVTNFLKVVIRYYAAIGDLELAENRFKVLEEIAPDSVDTVEAEAFLFPLRMQIAAELFAEERKQAIIPKTSKMPPLKIVKKPPQFNHPQIHRYLYQYGLAIPHEYLHEIIALPRKSLVEDLENILLDSVKRYHYFWDLGWEEYSHSFVLHSLFLLKEIEAFESLPKIISFLEYNSKFLEFWLGDHITETLWQCIYSLGFNNTPVLKRFLLQPGIDTYAKTVVSESLCQMVLHCPEKRIEVLAIFSEVFEHFSQSCIKDNIIDSDFLGFAISDAIDCNLYELLPVIKVLFDKNFIALDINGDFNEVKKELTHAPKRINKRDLYNIFELYNDLSNTWGSYNEDEEEDRYNTLLPGQIVSNKTGRNDPCPCGSGKKYKKCCLSD